MWGRLAPFYMTSKLLLLTILSVASAQQYTISTIAGFGRQSFVGAGGPGTSAPLIAPVSVIGDSSGNIFVSDNYFHQVFRILPDGTISVYAGNGTPGFSGDNGSATSAQLSAPGSLAVDTAGNLYINDTGNSCIRKVTTSGIISTFASVAVSGIALDSAGNLYATSGNTVGRVDPNGTYIVIAGTGKAGSTGDGGPAATARLYGPQGLKVDAAGNIFVADTQNHRVRKITPQGTITTVAGSGKAGFSGDGGLAIAASLLLPSDVALAPGGNLVIADSSNFRVRFVGVTGMITTVAGGGNSFLDGPANQAYLIEPSGVGIDNNGNILVALVSGRQVRRISAQGIINTLAGTGASTNVSEGIPATSAPLLYPYGVAVDGSGNVFVADNSDHRIRKVSTSGLITTIAGNGVFGDTGDGGPANLAQTGSPRSPAFDSQGNLYFTSGVAFRVRRIGLDGTIAGVAGTTAGFSGDGGSATSAQLLSPLGVAPDASGGFYIADTLNNRIRYVDPSGVITTIAGNGQPDYTGDNGPALAAQLFQPHQLALDTAGNLFIADTGNNVIRKISPAGIISTVAGTGVRGSSADGAQATATQLANPTGVAVDAQGNLYISTVAKIRRVDASTGLVTTIAGTGFTGFSGDNGPAISATLNGATYLALSGSSVYFTDTGNLRVRKLTSLPVVKSILNGATFQAGPVAPGEIVSLFGSGLGPISPGFLTLDASGKVASQLAGTQVFFDGISAPLLYVSDSQLNVVVPYEVSGSTKVSVKFNGNSSAITTLQVAASLPGLFAITNADGSLNSKSNPAAPGSYLVLYGTGEGQTNPGGIDGSVANSVYPKPVLPVTIQIGGQTANVLYAGAAPGFVAGVLQIDVSIPTGVSGTVPMQLKIGSATLTTSVYIP
jgi:uncharacterized protein (TIGR03437 family)